MPSSVRPGVADMAKSQLRATGFMAGHLPATREALCGFPGRIANSMTFDVNNALYSPTPSPTPSLGIRASDSPTESPTPLPLPSPTDLLPDAVPNTVTNIIPSLLSNTADVVTDAIYYALAD